MSEYTKQAEDFLKVTGTSFKAKKIGHGTYFDDDKESRDIYLITLERNEKKWSFKFGHSIANSGKKIKPSAYDVLAGITKNDPGTFNNFCADYGYDTDSRRAEKTYFAVQNEFTECEKMFRDVMEPLQEIA